jgi:flagellar M-ring protein FliF
LDRLPSSVASYPFRARDWWHAQTGSNRIVYGAVAVAVLAALAFFTAFRFRGPDYAVLFSNLQPDEANAVIQKLDAEKTPHRLADNGTTILVPHESVYEKRVALAGEGVVKAGGGTGFELFDRTNLGMTDFQEKIAKTRATEGELQRTIGGLGPVQSARVHIATPEASLYSSSQLPTTASVAIQTKIGMQLTQPEVRGITQLVAGAVEGLKPDNVTIVDQNGTILRPSALDDSSAVGDASSALKRTQEQLVAKEKFESNLQQSLQGLLDATIGAHRSAVRVASLMDFDAVSTESKTYAPQGTVLSEKTKRETYVGSGGPRNAAVGIPGTTSNVPSYQSTQSAGTGKYGGAEALRNYQVGEQISKHVNAPGKVTRLSVAVLVNVPAAAAALPNANGAPAYVVAAADVQKIRNTVVAAAGIDTTRGDQISVEAIPFAPTADTLALRGAQSTNVLGVPVVPFVAILAILGLVGAGFAFGMIRRRTFRPSNELPTFDSTLAEELPSFEEHPMLDGTPSIAAPIRSAADLTREQMIEYVTTVAQDNPDNIAKLVKLWLAE